VRTICANLLQESLGRGLCEAGFDAAWGVLSSHHMRGLRFAVIVLVLVGLAFAFRAGSPPSTVESGASSSPVEAPVAGTDHANDPAAPVASAAIAAPTSARTTIAILRVGDGGDRVELVSWVTKAFVCATSDEPPGATYYLLEDAVTGARLATGPCPMPDLCRCGGPDHRHGCARVRHEAVVRLKLPRVSATERLTIVGPEGPIAQFALEGA
jgi:hypothetical protein